MCDTNEPLDCPNCGEAALRFKRKVFWAGVGRFRCRSCGHRPTGIQTPDGTFIPMDTIYA